MPNIDLTTLPGWSSLSPGSHNITIVAKADGYRDSEPSAAVSVEKGTTSSGETWLLNDIVDGRTLQTTKVDFTSNNTSYSYIVTKKGYIAYSNSEEWNDTNMVYDTASWTNSAYRTITFETAPTGDLLTWLQANATKQ